MSEKSTRTFGPKRSSGRSGLVCAGGRPPAIWRSETQAFANPLPPNCGLLAPQLPEPSHLEDNITLTRKRCAIASLALLCFALGSPIRAAPRFSSLQHRLRWLDFLIE